MAPTNSTSKTTSSKSQVQGGNVTKPVLEKPAALRANKNVANIQTVSQNNDSSCVLNEMCKKIDTLRLAVESIQTSLDTLQGQLTVLSDRQVETLEKIDRNFGNVMDRLDALERQPAQVIPAPVVNANFTEEIIVQAREQLNVDLTVPLVHNGRNVLTLVPFNRNNINIYGTKLLGKLFKKRELAAGTVDPVRSTTPTLDPDRINLVKACYLKKLRSVEAFVDNWESIVKSLRQKCLDSKKYLVKHPEEAEDEEDDNATDDLEPALEEDNNEPTPNQQQQPPSLNRDVSMHSLLLN